MNKIEKHKEILDKMHELYITKNNDYHDSVHQTYKKYGCDSYLVRMEDKMNRLYYLTRTDHEQKVDDEKLLDTILDLANYSVLFALELEMEKE